MCKEMVRREFTAGTFTLRLKSEIKGPEGDHLYFNSFFHHYLHGFNAKFPPAGFLLEAVGS